MRSLTLHNGISIPQLGFGTWPLSDAEAEKTVATAVEHGYRLFDTAAMYGNETGVGRGLRAAGVRREDLFVTTKLRGRDHGYDRTLAAFEASRRRLGLDAIDLYLIHWPLPHKDRYVETWRAMASLLEQGRVRAIGVSNFTPAHIDRLLAETGVLPSVNQIQLHPGVAQARLRAYDQAKGIVTESWSPLGKGSSLLRDPVITGLARRHSRTPAQIVLRWHLQLGLVAIPKSSDPVRIAANIDVFDFALSDRDMAAIARLDKGDGAAMDPDLVKEE
jgi:2,5-diketo-D-gluconate reductase A